MPRRSLGMCYCHYHVIRFVSSFYIKIKVRNYFNENDEQEQLFFKKSSFDYEDFPAVQKVKSLPATQKTWVWSLGQEDHMEKGMATHSSIPAWRIPWTEDAGRLQSVGLQSWTGLATNTTNTIFDYEWIKDKDSNCFNHVNLVHACVRAELLIRVQLFGTPLTKATRLLCTWNSPVKNIRVGSHSLLQGIFLTQGSNPDVLH